MDRLEEENQMLEEQLEESLARIAQLNECIAKITIDRTDYWKPICTAPKGYTPIIACRAGFPEVWGTFYNDELDEWEDSGIDFTHWGAIPPIPECKQ